MKKVTDTLSKEIVAAAEGEIVGIVTNAYTDAKLTRLRGYKVSSEDRDEGRIAPLPRILAEGDALVVRNTASLRETTLAECPIGVKVYDTAGNLYGLLRDILFDEKSGEILTLFAGEREIAAGSTLSFGKNALLLRAPEHAKTLFRKPSAGRKKSPEAKENIPLLLPEAERQTPAEKEPIAEATADSLPQEVTQEEEFFDRDYAFLLGRKVVKDLGHIARTSDTVTPEVIRKARSSGKLVELTVNSRKE